MFGKYIEKYFTDKSCSFCVFSSSQFYFNLVLAAAAAVTAVRCFNLIFRHNSKITKKSFC